MNTAQQSFAGRINQRTRSSSFTYYTTAEKIPRREEKEEQNRENIGVAPIAPLNSVSRVETLRHGKKSEELSLKRVTTNITFYYP